MLAEAKLRQAMAKLGQDIEEMLKMEYLDQGHNLTGRGLNSIEYEVSGDGVEWEIKIYHVDYLVTINTGIPAARIPFGGRSGGNQSAFIRGLIRFVKLRRLASGFAQQLSVAIRIAKTMKREGQPTRGAFKFTKNGRRTGFIDFPINQNESNIQDRLYDIYYNFIADWLQDRIDEIISTYENAKPLRA